MIEPTDEMIEAYELARRGYWDRLIDADEGAGVRVAAHRMAAEKAGLAAVLALVERDLREQIAEALFDRAEELRGMPFRSGQVGIEYINGIEAACSFVEIGKWS